MMDSLLTMKRSPAAAAFIVRRNRIRREGENSVLARGFPRQGPCIEHRFEAERGYRARLVPATATRALPIKGIAGKTAYAATIAWTGFRNPAHRPTDPPDSGLLAAVVFHAGTQGLEDIGQDGIAGDEIHDRLLRHRVIETAIGYGGKGNPRPPLGMFADRGTQPLLERGGLAEFDVAATQFRQHVHEEATIPLQCLLIKTHRQAMIALSLRHR